MTGLLAKYRMARCMVTTKPLCKGRFVNSRSSDVVSRSLLLVVLLASSNSGAPFSSRNSDVVWASYPGAM